MFRSRAGGDGSSDAEHGVVVGLEALQELLDRRVRESVEETLVWQIGWQVRCAGLGCVGDGEGA